MSTPQQDQRTESAPPTPPPPPAPPSRAAGLLLILGGAAAIAAIWLPLIIVAEQSVSLADVYGKVGVAASLPETELIDLVYYGTLGGGVLAALVGVLAVLNGGQRAQLGAGLTGIVSAFAVGYFPVRSLVADGTGFVEAGGTRTYLLLAAPIVLAAATVVAFVKSGKTD